MNILVVEDDIDCQNLYLKILKRSGFNFSIAENGGEAVEMASQKSYDLILMDIVMPGMNGIEAIKKIREIPSYENIPIIAVTACAMNRDRKKCLEAGADYYISKPFKNEFLVQKIKELLNIKQVELV